MSGKRSRDGVNRLSMKNIYFLCLVDLSTTDADNADSLSNRLLVEHIGFEPMTSSMPWKRASQLRQCPKM